MKGKQTKAEKGITLVALAITVILLLILATITIRSLIGHEGLIDTTLTASEEHTIAQYREAIYQMAQEVILGNTTKGKDTTREDIAKRIREEEWVKEAEPDEESKTVRVITKEGYVFYVFYDEIYGKLEVENIGKDDPDTKAPYPKVKGRYEPKVASVFGSATVSEGNIAKIEIIYRNEVKKTYDNPSRRSKIRSR